MPTGYNRDMDSFGEIYKQLNQAQRQAVDTLDGPVLVIAGPGTGKTQLLTARIANILDKTDSSPENILCLTFTESATQTMRQRLSTMIGQAAYGVTISTYHAFGSELIKRYSSYFSDQPGQSPIDDLGRDAILRAIIASLPYGNPLKFADSYLEDIKSGLSDFKRALLTPANVMALADANDKFVSFANPLIQTSLAKVKRIDKAAVAAFEALAQVTTDYQGTTVGNFQSISQLWQTELADTLTTVAETGKTTALTTWKNKWLAKDAAGNFMVNPSIGGQRLHAAGEVYEAYEQQLQLRHLYDYDDMIIRAINGLEANPDLRYSLQEQYLYILLDEFQDTNEAQLRLVELLTDSPVNENRPNVLAVGDDDQAIYAFQGANYSHMLKFQQNYRDVSVIPLTENYRSTADVLRTAEAISGQIAERLQDSIPNVDKTLIAANRQLAEGIVQRIEFKTEVSQYAWVTDQIKKLQHQGIAASQIAVLAPQHRYLEPLVAYLHQAGLPVRYEKSEDILDEPLLIALAQMSRLILALQAGDSSTVEVLWPEVLSYDFWQLPTELIWRLSWQVADQRTDWLTVLLDNPTTHAIALFFIRLSHIAGNEILETMLDYLVGVQPVELIGSRPASYTSPFYEFYFDSSNGQTIKTSFWELLSSLMVLRAHLRNYRGDELLPLQLRDLVEFIAAHRAAEIKLLNTSPYQEAAEAVQLMTAYKAKGQEFAAVFVLACQDEVWGGKSRSRSSNLTLPPNLQPIRYAGTTNDERLRLFYVALTRAKTNLYLTSYTSTFSGKATTRLSFLNEQVEGSDVISPLLPAKYQSVESIDQTAALPLAALSANWQQRHLRPSELDSRALLQPRLDNYQLSPTDLNSFIDVEHGGPAQFFLRTILRFPIATSMEGQYGSAIHESLEWLNQQTKADQKIPPMGDLLATFERQLRLKRLSSQVTDQLLERGRLSLVAYWQQRQAVILPTNQNEYGFRHEAVFVGPAHLTGKIDKLIIDDTNKTITIVDYKTGKTYHRWANEPKLYRYKQQLYVYKLLVERSQRFKDYTVADCYLEFVEPDETGQIQELHLKFDQAEATRIEQLIISVWQHIMKLSFPDISDFTADLKGIEAFVASLVEA